MSDYKSFLICFHPNQTELYKNGLPIGVIRDGQFKVHQRKLADGSAVDIRPDLPLLDSVIEAINQIPR